MSEPANATLADLAIANRILSAQGVLDGFGHVSVRDPGNAANFLLARNMAPALVGPADIMRFTFSGAPIDSSDARRPYLERFIHAAIYATRADVHAVVHSHSATVIPFGIVRGATLRAVSHMGAFLGAGVPCFEIRDAAGADNDMLIRDAQLGGALAAALGAAPVVLMRGHGCTVVGTSLRQAVFRAVYTEFNARIQMDAQRLGEVISLNEHEARRAAEANDGQLERTWDLWRSAAGEL